MLRTANAQAKVERVHKALRHEEGDRIPLSDSFWGSFVRNWQEEFGLAADADPYVYYDLDWRVTIPNLDPHIKPFETLKETEEEVVVRTGFEAILRKDFSAPMPHFVAFDINTIEKLDAFEFDDPWDDARFFSAGDNQIAGVGDGFVRNSPPWIATVKSLRRDFAVFGSVCEANEYMTRIIGPANNMLWSAMYPEQHAHFVERANQFAVELLKAQIKAADGLLDGVFIWGDIAYTKDMFFSPDRWRMYYKPYILEMVNICHAAGLPVVYHGCGNVRRVLEDFIETGIDAYNPLEAKAGLDVIDLRRQYGHRLGFCGNMDVVEWARCDEQELTAIVLRKLNAGKGGGLLFHSDHSVASSIPPQNFDFVVNLVKQYGQYPLQLGMYDIADLH